MGPAAIARALVLLAALALAVSSAAMCYGVMFLGTVLIASPLKPQTEAWIVKSDCTYTESSLDDQNKLDLGRSEIVIDRVESLPLACESFQYLLVNGNADGLQYGADFSKATKLTRLVVGGLARTFPENTKLPIGLEYMYVNRANFNSLDPLAWPATMKWLEVVNANIGAIENLPPGLETLQLISNAVDSLDFPMPSSLETMRIVDNPVKKLEMITFPDSIIDLFCTNCKITTVRGVKWPSKLKNLSFSNIKNNNIQVFELRRSDFERFKTLSTRQVATTQTTCADSTAKLEQIGGVNFCVISDDRFNEVYGGGSNDNKSPSTDSSASADDSTASGSTSSSTNSGSGEGTSNSTTTSSQSSAIGSAGGSNVLAPGTGAGSTTDRSGENEVPNAARDSASSSSTLVIPLVVTASVLIVFIGIAGYRKLARSKNHDMDGKSQTLLDTPQTNIDNHDPSSNAGSSSQEYLTNDIRNDKALIPFRIDQRDITLNKQIARGGFGVIYRGSYQGRTVAVKQMVPDAWRNETMLSNFMDEIRLCATLTHPKIVEFVGVAWSSLRDLSVVIEYMAGGDLFAVLQRHAQAIGQSTTTSTSTTGTSASIGSSTLKSPPSSNSSSSLPSPSPSPRDWFDRWSAHSLNSKVSIARDVAEAVVYLHSFSSPILHRDLKARNVLLDARGNAKLSDFGISREMAVDETMTSEVGTSAWIAPEVLRGDRYSEMADMYSFGVLLVEMDRCRHPYEGEESLVLADGTSLASAASVGVGTSVGAGMGAGIGGGLRGGGVRETRSQLAHKNMQIAVLVSTGKLRPRPSRACPERVQSLIDRCLSFAPEDRPTAMEVHFELRKMR